MSGMDLISPRIISAMFAAVSFLSRNNIPFAGNVVNFRFASFANISYQIQRIKEVVDVCKMFSLGEEGVVMRCP